MQRDFDVHLGKRLRARRRLLGLTQREVAVGLGIRFQQIQKYECGGNRLSGERIWRLAAILGVPVTYFFEGLDPDKPEAVGAATSGLTRPRPVASHGARRPADPL
jgi:transcriptional regulator with XRE-family HTH domain